MERTNTRPRGRPRKPVVPAKLSPAGNTGMEALAVRVREACRISGFSRSKIYLEHKAGRLPFLKCGRTTLVPMDALRALLAALPRG